MATNLLGTLQDMKIAAGQNGRKLEFGSAAFTTTGATATVPTRLQHIDVVIAIPAGTPASDEVLSSGDVPGANGGVSVTGNILNFTRTGASKTSGLKFFYIALGW